MTGPARLLFCLALAAALPRPAPAQEAAALPPVEFEDGLDAGFARAAVLRGEILPLDQVLDVLRAHVTGELIEIQLEIEEGVLIYEIDLISPDGRLIEVEIDAATGRLLQLEEDEDD
ncbi:PepSY domain-containing protein [Pseudogemmobacter humi]|uniref:Peptidase propeptide and YPEB domain protein n=1 Tax=Pseudogemmobacter humi TaxID=2483812 RepID=A0A3P5X4H6_9RHOB|nr:PepSY domain-containing protein [Pseudogemmobacter humi]VDC29192.1 Peptidase propeptide and YPEB domain protein [Pseudogemmobacter humi]